MFCQLFCSTFWRKSWQSFRQIGRGISHKFTKVWTIFWMQHRESYRSLQLHKDKTIQQRHSIHACGLHFLKFHFKNKQQWGPLVCLSKKPCRKTIHNFHSWISHCTRFRLKQRTLKFWDQNFFKIKVLNIVLTRNRI